jgi:TonB family protein
MLRRIFVISTLVSAVYGQLNSSGDPIRIGPGVTPPKPIHRPEPTYSPEARSAGVQGTVLFELVVDERGLPTDIRLLSPLGYGLDERAQETIAKWRFQPGLKNGNPVKILANIEVNFRLVGVNFDAEIEKRRTQYNRALGLVKGDSKQKESAIKTFQELAEKKFPPAMYVYGELLAEGKEMPSDLEKSRALIERAAQAKFGPAMFAMATRSLEGKNESRDPKETKDMIRTAAILGSAQAQYFMGSAYEHGNPDLGFRQDEDSARQFYRLCAAAGQMLCQYRLGELLLNRTNAQERDILQAVAWLELSADQGEPEAKSLWDRSRASLTSEQTKRVATLKQQLVHRN